MKNQHRMSKTLFWVLILIGWSGLYEFARYQISMYYSNLVPNQFGDDSTYGLLKLQPTSEKITFAVFLFGMLFILYRLYRTWFPKDKIQEAQ